MSCALSFEACVPPCRYIVRVGTARTRIVKDYIQNERKHSLQSVINYIPIYDAQNILVSFLVIVQTVQRDDMP